MANRKRKAPQATADEFDGTNSASAAEFEDESPASVGQVAEFSSTAQKGESYYRNLYASEVDFRRLAKQHQGFADM
jgi:hypothetical protein